MLAFKFNPRKIDQVLAADKLIVLRRAGHERVWF